MNKKIPGPADKIVGIPPSGIRKFFDMVLEMKEVISLGVGEPDFVTPWNVRESAIYSLEQGYTSYTSNWGMKELRTAIAKFLSRRRGIEYDPDCQVLITVGVSEATDLALRAILDPGDEVLIPDPCFVSYGPLTTLAGGKPVSVPTTLETGFKMSPAQLEKAVSKRTKAIFINYPSNPTGASYSRAELLKIAALAKKKNLLVLSDEVYDELTYEGTHTAFPSLRGMMERTVYLNGFSKAYAMTGWRIGYACGPKEILAEMMKIHQYSMMCVSITGQFAALEAIRNGTKSVAEMLQEYSRRRNFVVEELNRLGLDCHKPEGAFYAFPSVKKTGMTGVEFATGLLKQEKVAVVPGIAFSPNAVYNVRLSYATAFDDLREALLRMGHFLKTQ